MQEVPLQSILQRQSAKTTLALVTSFYVEVVRMPSGPIDVVSQTISITDIFAHAITDVDVISHAITDVIANAITNVIAHKNAIADVIAHPNATANGIALANASTLVTAFAPSAQGVSPPLQRRPRHLHHPNPGRSSLLRAHCHHCLRRRLRRLRRPHLRLSCTANRPRIRRLMARSPCRHK